MSAPEEDPPPPQKFPPTFYYANGIELFERLAFYGTFVGLALYLHDVVGYSDTAVGPVMGTYRLVSSLAPIVCGSIADRITFKRSLVVAFVLYALGYGSLFAFPSPLLAPVGLLLMAIGGGFMKPVITGTVVRTSPPGRQTEGFAIFYRMINAGSVVGKTLAYVVRRLVAMRFVMINSVVASIAALGLAVFGYREPTRGGAKPEPLADTMRGYGNALRNLKLSAFLVIFAGFYFMADQFYVTFPQYVTRHIDKKAPLEFITLINPALIALLQSTVTRLAKRLSPVSSMLAGMLIASLSMLVMGAVPGLLGACLSGAIFAFAEMTFSPRFYDYIASFAPEGKAGMYMGLAFVPFAIGSFTGGLLSGPMVAKHLPVDGPRHPFTVWATYAACGLGCAFLMVIYRRVFADRPKPVAA